MNPAGEMIGFKITQHSGDTAFAIDRRLQRACNETLSDDGPPPGARAKDGNIHFIFRATLKSEPTPEGLAFWVRLEAGLL